MNYLKLDDVVINQEGKLVDPDSIMILPTNNGLPVFSEFKDQTNDPFLIDINKSGKKWIIIADKGGQPCVVLNANAFLRSVLFNTEHIDPIVYCHRPVVVKDAKTLLGKVLSVLWIHPKSKVDNVIENDLIFFMVKREASD